MGRTQASLDEIIDLCFTRSQTWSVIPPGFKGYWKDVLLLDQQYFFKAFRLCKLFSVLTQKLTFYSHFLLSIHVGNHQSLGGRLRRLLKMGYKPFWLPCKELKMLKSMIGVVVMCASGKGGAGSRSELPYWTLGCCNLCRIWPSATAARQEI